MNNLRRPVFVGVDQIMSGYDSLNKDGNLIFAVWYGNAEIAFQCAIADKGIQEEMLRSNIQALSDSGNTDLLLLKLYPKMLNDGAYIEHKTKPVSVTPIQAMEYQGIVGAANPEQPLTRPTGMSFEAWEMLKSLKDLPTSIDAKIDAKLKEILAQDEEEEEPVNQTEQILNTINGLASNPLIAGLAQQLGAFLMKLIPAPTTNQIGMSEVPQITNGPTGDGQTIPGRIPFNEDRMNDALERLSYHCDLGEDLQKLASVAETNPAQFSMLLSMLRKM